MFNPHRRTPIPMSLKSDFEASLSAPPIGQKQLHSIIEAVTGTAVGFIISWALLSFLISPLFHLKTNYGEDFLITCIFTVASVLRSYGVRRFFNWWHLREWKGIANETRA